MAIIPKIEAITLFFASSDNFDHKYMLKKTINGIPTSRNTEMDWWDREGL